jgi:4'-phosphopantetheinyl transferase
LEFARTKDLPEQDDGWLSPRERNHLGTLRIAKRRNDWLLGRWVAKQAARQLYDHGLIEIIAADDGAPELYVDAKRTNHTLSISHSNGFAMAAIGGGSMRMGCDVEYIEPRSREFIACYFTAPEAELVALVGERERPLVANLIWSAKESVLKGARVGLRFDTRRVEVAFARGLGWQPFWAQLDGVCWHGHWRAQRGWIHTIACCPL